LVAADDFERTIVKKEKTIEVTHINLCYKLSYPCTGLDRALGLRELEASRISRHSTREGGSLKLRSPLSQKRKPWYLFLLEVESTPGSYCGRTDEVNGKSQ
jgi:hypothetical protein